MMQNNNTSNGAANSSHKKRLKVPKRGPGVAELEKMMREQNGIYTTDKIISESTDGNQYGSIHLSSKNLYNESNPFWSHFGTILKRNNESSRLNKGCQIGRILELSNTRYSSDIEVHGANVLPFATAEVPSPPLHLCPMHPCQVIQGKVNSYQQHSEASRLYRRPFYNFLEVKGVTEDTNPEECLAGKLGIDLNLKL
ncbi:hypothetical protein LR48_Vigan07g015700 [Vigna angularis]|uniref:Uncharacterized protein n=1 Tax=Phaseolus angularis TaxID=3914 RepID=A0A0L9UUP4_PHAAN|nr:uncharacterized protein HKW66_Vig0133270 [Vigna angularis]KOM46453.1 hypothetical protein LR48_Vigan07g015700 [Vigna angularis]